MHSIGRGSVVDKIRRVVDIFNREGIAGIWDHTRKKIGLSDALLSDVEQYNRWMKADPSTYPDELAHWYYIHTGKKLDLHNPQTFNEKLQWLKLYDSTPLKTRLADKYLVRDWLSEQVGNEYLVPLLGVWNSFDEINFDLLPQRFALKVNQGSGWNLIVSDKSKIDLNVAKANFDRWMNTNFAFVCGLELHYKDIIPKIICEEYIENVNGLVDYRFYCFNGRPLQVWVDTFSGTPNHMREIYDMEWKKLPIRCTWPNANGLLDNEPANFGLMKEFAKKLSAQFKFVRVDFYEVNGHLYMGEMTFIPMSGIGVFEPAEWDIKLGEELDIN